MNVNWKKVFIEIAKYAVSAILGALGFAVSGCVLVPQLNY